MGKCFCKITEEALDLSMLVGQLSSVGNQDSKGAVNWFVGNVRNLNDEHAVEAVTYEGAAALGETVLFEICKESQIRWGLALDILVYHRVGCLRIGETSVVIGVSSAHRNEAFEASRYIIEQIKLRLPIWKREHYTSGEETWLRGVPLNSKSTSGNLP